MRVLLGYSHLKGTLFDKENSTMVTGSGESKINTNFSPFNNVLFKTVHILTLTCLWGDVCIALRKRHAHLIHVIAKPARREG